MKLIKLRKNKKAISPIFATLILIAIAVIAGIVVYMFTSGFLSGSAGGGTAGQEKVAIQSVTGVGGTTPSVTVIYQSTGGPIPTIVGLLVKDASGNTVATESAPLSSTPTATGALTTVASDVTGIMATGSTYTVTLISEAGGSFVSSSFVAT